MISIIIVSLNTKKDFKKSLKSALSQTKKSEIIVIDGKSNDGTIEIIKKNRKNLSAFKIEKDKGIYSAMNKGVKLAKRKWIYFLNSGDIFYNKNTIEKITKILKKNSNFDVLIGNSFIKKDKFLFKSPRKQFSKNSLHSCFSHQSTFVKLNSLKKSPFNPNYK